MPLLAAAGVFSFVLQTTPPGFGAIGEVVFGLPRGANAEAAAYAIGAAASLALVALLGLALPCAALEMLLQRLRRT